jgi:AbrB family looped-hinge helix DNA binding protein
MLLTVTSKRQVTFPKRVMESLRIRKGDTLVLTETEDGLLLKTKRFDVGKLAPLQGKFSPDLPAPDLEAIRHAAKDPSLRD